MTVSSKLKGRRPDSSSSETNSTKTIHRLVLQHIDKKICLRESRKVNKTQLTE